MSLDHCQNCNTTYNTDTTEHECVEDGLKVGYTREEMVNAVRWSRYLRSYGIKESFTSILKRIKNKKYD